MSDAPERPGQVTVAAWLIMGGSVLLVASVFERIAGLHTLETQRAVEKFLAEPPGDGLGLSTDDVLGILRVLCMVAGACAAAAAILGFHVLRRSKSARVGLAVLAAPLFVSGMAAGGFLASFIAAASVMLWLQPSRDWFNGIVHKPARPEPRTSPDPPAPPPPGPRAVSGFGTRAAGASVDPATHAATTTATVTSTGPTLTGAATSGQTRSAHGVRPRSVLWACILTWAFGGFAIAAMAFSVLMLLTVPDLIFDELDRQNPNLAADGLTHATIATATYVISAIVIVWSCAAIAFAAFAFRRVRWARHALLACAALAAVVCLAGAVFNLLLALPLAGSVVAVSLLLRPEARAWFRS